VLDEYTHCTLVITVGTLRRPDPLFYKPKAREDFRKPEYGKQWVALACNDWNRRTISLLCYGSKVGLCWLLALLMSHQTFWILTAVTIRINVVSAVTPCSLVEGCQPFGGTCCIHCHPQDGKKASREYIGACLPKYKASHPRIWWS